MIDAKIHLVSADDDRHTGQALSDVVNGAGELALSVIKRGTLSDGDWSGFHKFCQRSLPPEFHQLDFCDGKFKGGGFP